MMSLQPYQKLSSCKLMILSVEFAVRCSFADSIWKCTSSLNILLKLTCKMVILLAKVGVQPLQLPTTALLIYVCKETVSQKRELHSISRRKAPRTGGEVASESLTQWSSRKKPLTYWTLSPIQRISGKKWLMKSK